MKPGTDMINGVTFHPEEMLAAVLAGANVDSWSRSTARHCDTRQVDGAKWHATHGKMDENAH